MGCLSKSRPQRWVARSKVVTRDNRRQNPLGDHRPASRSESYSSSLLIEGQHKVVSHALFQPNLESTTWLTPLP
jgi:hypothetical protein